VANNVPAFEFNTDGTYRGLLVEPGATNLLLRSQEFGTTWGTQGLAVTSNTTVAPDGATTGDTITGDGTQTTVYIDQSITFASAGTYTLSFFAKAGTHDIIRVNIANYMGSTSTLTGYNLTNGTTTIGGNPITAVGNGWYRIQFTFTIDAGDLVGAMRIFLSPSTGTTAWSSAGDSNTKSVVLWQAQLETGSVATSPIVTTAGTASRVADVITLTSASSLIGQTANTLYVEGEIQTFTGASDACIFALTDGTNAEAIVIGTVAANGRIEAVVRDGGSDQATIASGSFTTGVFKCAIASAVNDVAFYLNGSSVGTDTSATHPALSVFQFGGTVAVVAPTARPVWFRAIADFPTRIANATLVNLTTL
jgi:hypothetical protein